MADNAKEEFNIRYLVLTAIAVIGLGVSMYAMSKPHVNVANEPKSGSPAILGVTVVSSTNNKLLNVNFPYYRDGINGEKLDFNFNIIYAAGQSGLFRIVPDDCLEKLNVNGKEIGLTKEANAKRCDWQGGFAMDLSATFPAGLV